MNKIKQSLYDNISPISFIAVMILSSIALGINAQENKNVEEIESVTIIGTKDDLNDLAGSGAIISNDDLQNCYSKIHNLINAEISNGSKDYDLSFIRNHVEKLTN